MNEILAKRLERKKYRPPLGFYASFSSLEKIETISEYLTSFLAMMEFYLENINCATSEVFDNLEKDLLSYIYVLNKWASFPLPIVKNNNWQSLVKAYNEQIHQIISSENDEEKRNDLDKIFAINMKPCAGKIKRSYTDINRRQLSIACIIGKLFDGLELFEDNDLVERQGQTLVISIFNRN